MVEVLEYGYLAAALAIGVLLYWRNPPLYVGFVWWVFFLTPEVRRLIDYQFGWNPTSPVMLAPSLLAALTFFTLLRHLPKLQFYPIFPFGLVFLGLFYGYGVGALRLGWQASTWDLINWMVPVVFGFYLIVHWRNYPSFRRAVQRTFVWGVLAMGLYGLLQFFDPPLWDQEWMTNAGMTSVGSPAPFEVRVFSTLNSPGPFALVMMAGLLLLSSGGGLLRWPAAGVGFVSFLLSLVRSAWGGWLSGLIFMAAQRGRFAPRLIVGLVVAGLIAFPLISVGPVAEVVNERLQTVNNLEEDPSAQSRETFYSTFAERAFSSPVGEGLGKTGLATKLSSESGESNVQLGEFGAFDSGIMNIPFVLGWAGSLLYLTGLIWSLFYALRSGASHSDVFAAASRGIVVAVLTQLIFVNSLNGVVGMVFWSFLSMSLAAQLYHVRSNADYAKTNREASSEDRSIPHDAAPTRS